MAEEESTTDQTQVGPRRFNKEGATLVAAIIAALASVFGVAYSAFSTGERELNTFRRSQVERLLIVAFSAGSSLQARFASSQYVPWLKSTEETDLIEKDFTDIESIRYTFSSLVQMKAVPETTLPKLEDFLETLIIDWQVFSSARDAYRKAVLKGVIEESGEAGEDTQPTSKRYEEQRRRIGEKLTDLRTFIGEVQSEAIK